MIRSFCLAKSIRATSCAGYASSAINNVDGVKFLAQDTGASTSTLALVAKAGSRYETKQGLSHYLKNFAFKNTTKKTAFRITRETELQGGSISAHLDREHIIYTAQFFREDAPYFIEILSDVAQHTKYADYERADVAQKVALEVNLATPEAIVLNALHREAFRAGLGNSTLASPYSDINTQDIANFAKKVMAQDRLTFIGLNVDNSLLSRELGKHFTNSPSSSNSTPATKYFGGESRAEGATSSGHLAIAFEGAHIGSEHTLSLIVLQHLLGGQIHLKWGSGVSPLSKIAASQQAQVAAFNFSYSDSGLFGIYITSPTIAETTNLALAELRKLSTTVATDDLKRAIAQAKFTTLASTENSLTTVISLGTKVSLLGKVVSTESLANQFQNVSAQSISEIATKLLASKPTVAAYGRLSSVPYVDELKI